MLDALELPAAWLPPALESPAVSAETPAASRWRRARATRRPARSASASRRRGRLSVVLGTSGVVFAALPASPATRRGARTSSATPYPGGWHAMGVMLSRRGLARAGSATRSRPASPTTRWSPRRSAGSPAPKGSSSCPTSPASGRRTSTRTHAGRSSASRCATTAGALVRAVLEGVAYGLRGLARDPARARLPRRRRPRLGRRRPQRPLAQDRRLRPRAPARADGGRGGSGLRRGAARRRRRAASSRRRTRRWPRACACATRSSPIPPGSASTRTGTPATARCIRHFDPWRRR